MDEARARRLVGLYADMILRIACNYMKNTADAEDICQTVFLKYLSKERQFASDTHEKAWMIRTAINACKDQLKSAHFRRTVGLEAAEELAAEHPCGEDSGVLQELMRLPEKYRISLYLYYFEGYSSVEIGELLHRSEDAVNACLSRGRKKLRAALADSGFGPCRQEMAAERTAV